MEFQLVGGYPETGPGGDFFIQRFIDRVVQIDYPAAGVAAEVVVGGEPVLVAAQSACASELDHEAHILEHLEVAIDGAPTDAGDFLPHLAVDGLGGGMGPRVFQDPEDGFPLPGFPAYIISNNS